MKKSYLLKGIDPELWKDFKAVCAHHGVSMRETLLYHVQFIVDDFNMLKGLKKDIKPKQWKEGKKR